MGIEAKIRLGEDRFSWFCRSTVVLLTKAAICTTQADLQPIHHEFDRLQVNQSGKCKERTMTTATVSTHDDHHDHGHPSGIKRWLFTTNHKDIGTMYMIFALIMFMVGGAMIMGVRAELFSPECS